MMNPLISVVVPCYNQAEFLSETLESVFNQSFQNWECIVVNDGSGDNTAEIAQKICARDSRFIYLSQQNKGVSAARNTGLKIAKGDFIQFLDGDDIIRNDKLSKSYELANADKENILVISNFVMFTENSENVSKAYCILNEAEFNYESFLTKWDIEFTIPIHCGFFKRNILTGFEFNENLKGREDWFMWLYAIQQSTNVKFIDEPMALYRMHNKGATKNYMLMHEHFVKALHHAYSNLDTEGKQKIFEKVADLYLKEGAKNALILQNGLNIQDLIEIEKGKKALGFIGSFFFRILRKTGHLLLTKNGKS